MSASPLSSPTSDLEMLRLRLHAGGGVVVVLTDEEPRVRAWLDMESRKGTFGQNTVIREWTPSDGFSLTEKELATWLPNRRRDQTRHAWTFLRDCLRLPPVGPIQPRILVIVRGLAPMVPEDGRPLQEGVIAEDPIRLLRDVAVQLRQAGHSLVLAGARLPDSDVLRPLIPQLHFPLLGHRRIGELLDDLLLQWAEQRGGKRAWEPALRQAVLRACKGLSQPQIEDALLSGFIASGGASNADALLAEISRMKSLALRQVAGLQLIPTRAEDCRLGGCDVLKAWIARRSLSLSPEARAFGVEPPRGILSVGVPGAGKGVAARYMAHEMQLPLVRLEWSALLAPHVGESEGALRTALRVVEAQAPCVLWIDEIDKALVTGGDDGASQAARGLVGTLLTWMQERKEPVVLYCTANRIDGLPPELMRKGRLDEVFFFDLPVASERIDILGVHLKTRAGALRPSDWAAVAAATFGFTGAECASVVQQGLMSAFSSERELVVSDLLTAAEHTVPMVRGQPEMLARIRELVTSGRAIRAGVTDPEHDKINQLLARSIEVTSRPSTVQNIHRSR